MKDASNEVKARIASESALTLGCLEEDSKGVGGTLNPQFGVSLIYIESYCKVIF